MPPPREDRLSEEDCQPVIWFTGLSGAGKSTLASRLARELRARGREVELLDSDVLRARLSPGQDFTRQGRDIHVRRLGLVAGLLARHGIIVIVAAISPYRSTRQEVRALFSRFAEVYVKCPLEVLIERDPKGLYRKALRGEIQNFTGVSDDYEEPLQPEILVSTDTQTVEESHSIILRGLEALGYLPTQNAGK